MPDGAVDRDERGTSRAEETGNKLPLLWAEIMELAEEIVLSFPARKNHIRKRKHDCSVQNKHAGYTKNVVW